MSDRSGYTSSESEDNRSYDRSSDDGGSEDDRDSDGDERAEPGEIIETTTICDFNNLNMCSVHKPGDMTTDCASCKAALAIVSDKNVKKLLTQNSANSGLISRYSGRCDEQPPTLFLSPASLEIAQSIFSKGVFKNRKDWQEIVRKFLTLPPAQHEFLTADIKAEDLLNQYKNEKRFKYIFLFHKDIVEILRNLRVTQRPLLSLIEKNHGTIQSVKKLGETAGVVYPVSAPVRIGGNVPREGRSLTDQLHVASSDGLFPRPNMTALIESAALSEDQAQKVNDFIEDYRVSVGKQYMDLFKSTANYLNDCEDQLVFYTDLYSHVDASLRDVIREKMASLFRSHVKSDVLRETSTKQLSEKASGLFGGSCLKDIFSFFLLFLNLILFRR